MDRVIRIPNKVLIIAALILVVGGTAFTWGGDDALFAAGKALQDRGLMKESFAAYQALVSTFGGSEYRAEALVRMAQHLPPHSEGYFDREFNSISEWFIPPGQGHLWRQGGISFKGVNVKVWEYGEAIERKIIYLESALEAGLEAAWKPRALAELGYAKAALGDYKDATPLFAEAWQSVDYRIENPWIAIWLGRTYQHLNRLDEAEVVLREALEASIGLEQEVRIELADVLESQGAFSEALEVLQPLPPSDNLRFGPRSAYGYRVPRLEYSLNYLEGEHRAVAGQITLNGEGLPGIRVLLSTYHEHPNGGISRTSPPQMVAQVVTDEGGHFELFDIDPGTYAFDMFIPMQLAAESSVELKTGYIDVREGKTAWLEVDFDSRFVKLTRAEIEDAEPYPLVHLAWEEVPGAAQYMIEVWGGYPVVPPDVGGFVVDGTTATLPLDRLFQYPGGGGGFYSGLVGEMKLSLGPILGVRHPDLQLDFQVRALDDAGNPLGRGRVICPVTCGGESQDRVRLDPPRPELTEADLLLLERRYDEAIAAYERVLEDDPYDYHSLFVLWNLATWGTDNQIFTHRDPERKKHYGERLLELTEHEWHRREIEASLSW